MKTKMICQVEIKRPYINQVATALESIDWLPLCAEALIAAAATLWLGGFICSINNYKDLYVAEIAPIYARFGRLLGTMVFLAYSVVSLLLWLSAVAVARLGKIIDIDLLPLAGCAVAVCFVSTKAANFAGKMLVKRKYPLEYQFFQFKRGIRLR